ncbi:MAG: 1-deoxy-D-xylulose-5-phosphate reductoisomerase [Chloroflexota bacterium]
MGSSVRQIAVLGSTGSIGRQALEVIRAFPERFRVVALAAGDNTELLARQASEFKPKYVYCRDEKAAVRIPGEFLSLEAIASHAEVDTVVVATAGAAGLCPTLAAVRAGKRVALSNKEPLVMAGEIITAEARRCGAELLPVDSEHSAIWQCLKGEEPPPARLILTASGGPFRGYSAERLRGVTVAQALAHPSWQMGPKVTIDSATLMNKGLEIIEAHWLFDIPLDRISVVIHPQSIVHSMVEFSDGAVKAQLSCPDMRLPIQYALSHPERLPNPRLPRLDWADRTGLTFEPVDGDTFPCLGLAARAGRQGGTYPAVLCGADEAAVGLFLAGRLGFTGIARLVALALEQHRGVARPTLEEIMAADAWARETVVASGDKV